MKERRSGQERRQNQATFNKFLIFNGNRRMVRRADDRKRIILLDRYEPTLFYSVMTVLCLSLLDGALTLLLLEHQGTVELNPVMRYFLRNGPVLFLVAKYVITALALFVLVILHAITSPDYRIGIYLLPFCKLTFGSVVIWELFLLYKFF